MDKQYQITGLGIGGIATLLAAAYQATIYPLFLILPLVILAVMAMYEAESRAIIRAGEYIKKLETKIIIENKDLGWERWLASPPEDQTNINGLHKSCEETSARSRIYNLIDLASRCVLFLLYLGCIPGIITSPTVKNNFIFVGGDIFRYIIFGFYSLLGLAVFLFYLIEQNKKRKAINETPSRSKI